MVRSALKKLNSMIIKTTVLWERDQGIAVETLYSKQIDKDFL